MKVYRLVPIVFLTLFLTTCSKETENLSRSTYYVAFEILGDNPVIVQVGEEYVDAGAIATLQGQDVTDAMVVKSNVNDNAMGMYRVEYSHVNTDGLESRAIRDVIVCNPNVTADLSGTWNVSEDSYRLVIASGAETNYGGDDYTVRITRLAPGFFAVSDFLAGWYTVLNPNVGARVAMSGYFSMNEDNTINVLSSYIEYWGVGLDFLNNGIYDPDSEPDVEIIQWEAGFGAALGSPYGFNVSLTKEK